MKTEQAKVSIQFQVPLLGSACGNPEVHREFIANRAPVDEMREEESEAVERAVDVAQEVKKATTVFPRTTKGELHIWDYVVKGFFKEGLLSLIELGDCAISKWQYKGIVDKYVFVSPRVILLTTTQGVPLLKPAGTLERPLRASTMQGDRIALASSEWVLAGTTINFELRVFSPDKKPGAKSKFVPVTMDLLKQCLDFGAMKGFGQWRSGGYGRFTYKIEPMEPTPFNPCM